MDQRNGSEPSSLPASPSSNGPEIVGYLLAGVVVWGGVGLWLDHLLGTSFLTPIGLASGWVLGSYLTYVKVMRAPGAGPNGPEVAVPVDMERERKSV
ncbi:MAG: hypothetical protein ABI586_00220 [Candidatus Nanopelagicales bacterium]